MAPHSSYEHALRRIFPNCLLVKSGKVLSLPYQSRDPITVQNLAREALYLFKCGEREEYALVFLVRGLRDKIIVCRGSQISICFEDLSTSDSLSGLILRLRRPVLCVDECRVGFEWRKSRFVLDVNDLAKCDKCLDTVV